MVSTAEHKIFFYIFGLKKNVKHFQTKRLSTEGGTSVQECVDRVMKKLLTRAVGSLYSYMGRKQRGKEQKLAFCSTNMCKVVKGIIVLQFLFIKILDKCNNSDM